MGMWLQNRTQDMNAEHLIPDTSSYLLNLIVSYRPGISLLKMFARKSQLPTSSRKRRGNTTVSWYMGLMS